MLISYRERNIYVSLANEKPQGNIWMRETASYGIRRLSVRPRKFNIFEKLKI
jgi:hypothetical protein